MTGTIHGRKACFVLKRTARITALIFLYISPMLAGSDDVLFKAMHDELDRSMTKLQLADLDKPYFIAYTVQDGTNCRAAASLDSLLEKTETRARFLTVEVRVGGRALDNTNFFSSPFGATGVVRMFGGTVRLPLEDDYLELRRQMWLATDGAYKKALEDISRKRAALRNRTEAERLADFSQEAPVQIREDVSPVAVNLEESARLVKELSAVFRQMPGIFTSKVRLGVSNVRTLYVNSEGSSFTRTSPTVSLIALAATQAPDGMPLQDFVAIYGRSMGELPGKEALAARVQEMGARLQKLREAPLLDRYNGPVLFEGQAAAEIFSQILTPRLLAVRRPVAENPQVEAYLGSMDNPFLDKLGARVLPEFLTVVDNATLPEFNHTRMLGSYKVDDEGVRAREIMLVEKGILKTLLNARSPVSGIEHSTGSRRSSGVLPSNLIVSPDKGLSDQELRTEFFKLIKQRGREYGIVVRRLGNPAIRAAGDQMDSTFTPPGQGEEKVAGPILAYKVYPDGHEELVRNTELVGLSSAAFRDIVAVSSSQTVYSCPFASRALSLYSSFMYFDTAEGEPGAPLVSFVVPALLFEDLTVKKPNDQIPKPPLSKPPIFDR